MCVRKEGYFKLHILKNKFLEINSDQFNNMFIYII